MKRPLAIILLAGLAVLTTLVIYPIAHEGGHFLCGKMLGAEVRHVVWTPLSGRPHVSFGPTPGHHVPWINAAGLFLPTFIATVGIISWMIRGQRWPRGLSAAVLVVSVIMLSGNLGPIAELLEEPNLQIHHMYPLAYYFGLSGLPSILFQLLPAAVSLALVLLCLRKIRKMKLQAKAAETIGP